MKFSNISFNEITSSLRFDGSYHLSEGVLYTNKIQKMNFEYLGDLTSEIFTAGRTKRIYTSKEFGYPYLSNSDVSRNNPFDSCNYSSKKYGFDENSVLKEGMIVTGRVGAIGQTSYISSEFEKNKAMGSDNIIRIVTKNKNISGYVYAFLASKFGKTFFNKLAAGGVQPYISEDMIKDIPVPLLPETKQQQIHQLIVEASALRVEANKLLKEAVTILEEKINLKINTKVSQYQFNKVKFKDIINNDQKRIDSPVYITSTKNFITQNNKNKKLIELGFKVYRPGIFKRVKVEKENGMPYIKGSELSKFNPFLDAEYLSHTKTPYIEEMLLKSDQILLTCAGSVGIAKIITKEYEENKAIGSQDIIRIQKDQNSLSINYLFTYLKTDFAFDFLNSIKYGSVIERLEPFHVESVPVLIPDKDLEMKINRLIDLYKENYYQSFKKENQAIDLIEKEIDAWQ